MKVKKNIFIIIGLVLVLAQIISFVGLANGKGLYTEGIGYYSSYEPGFSISKLLFAPEAGIERFITSFGDLVSGDEWTPASSTQMTSGAIRSSLDNNGFALFIYDVLLTVCYCLAGIAGGVFLIIGTRIKRRMEYAVDTPATKTPANNGEPEWKKFLE